MDAIAIDVIETSCLGSKFPADPSGNRLPLLFSEALQGPVESSILVGDGILYQLVLSFTNSTKYQ